MKPRMTKQRLYILEKLGTTALAWGYGEQGGKEYFFTDGTGASPGVVEGMLRAGILKHKIDAMGVGQELVRA